MLKPKDSSHVNPFGSGGCRLAGVPQRVQLDAILELISPRKPYHILEILVETVVVGFIVQVYNNYS